MAAAVEIKPSSDRVLNGVGSVNAPSLVLAGVLTGSVSYADSSKLVKSGEIQAAPMDEPRAYSPANSVLPFHLLDHSYFSLNGFLEKISANKGRKRKLSVDPSSGDSGSAAKKPTQVSGVARGARKVSLSREQSEDEDKLLSLLQAAESTDRKGSFSSGATGGRKNAAGGKGSGKKRNNKSQKENESKSPTSGAGSGATSGTPGRKRENSKSEKDLDSTTAKQRASKSEKQLATSSGSASASGDKGRKLTVKLFGKAASAAATTAAGKAAAGKSAKAADKSAKGSSALTGRKVKNTPVISQASTASSQSRNSKSPRKR